MKYHHTHIQKSTVETTQKCVVSSSMPLWEVISFIDLNTTAYILVVDDAGKLEGIVETEEVLRRLGVWNSVERNRWSEMPIQSMLKWKLSLNSDREQTQLAAAKFPEDCMTVTNHAGLVALVTDDDVYVSWETVKNSLSQALTDHVTGLPNRAVFDRRLSEEYARAQRDNTSLAVVLIDVDHFKTVNDQYGHSVGDLTLQLIAEGLQKHLRSYDVLARYGGDEFAAICTACGPDEIEIPIRRIQAGIRSAFAKTSVALPEITLSIGAATIHKMDESHTPSELVELADMCLYRAKGNGRACAFKLEIDPQRPESRHPVLIEESNPDLQSKAVTTKTC